MVSSANCQRHELQKRWCSNDIIEGASYPLMTELKLSTEECSTHQMDTPVVPDSSVAAPARNRLEVNHWIF